MPAFTSTEDVTIELPVPGAKMGCTISAGGLVRNVIPGGPASKAGVFEGVFATSLNGHDCTSEEGLHRAVQAMQQSQATQVRMTIKIVAESMHIPVYLDYPDETLGLHYEKRKDSMLKVTGLAPQGAGMRAGVRIGMLFDACTVRGVTYEIRDGRDLQFCMKEVREGRDNILHFEMFTVPEQGDQGELVTPSPPRGNGGVYAGEDDNKPSTFQWDGVAGNGTSYANVPSHAMMSGRSPAEYDPDDLLHPAHDEIDHRIIEAMGDAPLLLAVSQHVQYPPPPFPEGGGVGGPPATFRPARRFEKGRGYFDANPSAAFRKVRQSPVNGGVFPSARYPVRRDVRPDYFDPSPKPNFQTVPDSSRWQQQPLRSPPRDNPYPASPGLTEAAMRLPVGAPPASGQYPRHAAGTVRI